MRGQQTSYNAKNIVTDFIILYSVLQRLEFHSQIKNPRQNLKLPFITIFFSFGI